MHRRRKPHGRLERQPQTAVTAEGHAGAARSRNPRIHLPDLDPQDDVEMFNAFRWLINHINIIEHDGGRIEAEM